MAGIPSYRVLNSYVHLGRIGVLAEFGCESDFVAKSDKFRTFMNDVTMHIAANVATDLESLHEESFFRDESRTVGDMVDEASHQFREGICVLRFVRWSIDDYERPSEPIPPRNPASIFRSGHR